MKKIIEIAKKIGLNPEDVFCYGDKMAKIVPSSSLPTGNLILVTAVNPTPYGEGKTTVTIGLNDALCSMGKKSVAVLREPSLGPVFGLKGGATGGGRASLVPEEEINFHFTGDFHAITSANNLLCAAIDNHIFQGNALGIDSETVCVKRCMDMNDRALRGSFVITAASTVMASFCLATDEADLRRRLGNILIGYTKEKAPLFAKDLKVDGAMALLLKDAFHPNLVQSKEENPVLVHGGPFANIAHGCNSIVSTKTALSLADYVVTEAGFGSDLGAEKFFNIKCRVANIRPSFVVLVATVRALKHSGMENLVAHIDHLRQYHVPFCVAINHFSDDKEEEIEELKDFCQSQNVSSFVVSCFEEGGKGGIALANFLLDHLDSSQFTYLYKETDSLVDKIQTIATKVYGANDVHYSDDAIRKLEEIRRLGKETYPICMAKTPYSLSDDKEKLGYPKNYSVSVQDISIDTGSEMVIVYLNQILTMPGLPEHPNYEQMQ